MRQKAANTTFRDMQLQQKTANSNRKIVKVTLLVPTYGGVYKKIYRMILDDVSYKTAIKSDTYHNY